MTRTVINLEGVSDGLASSCQSCGETPSFDWHVTDEMWLVVMEPYPEWSLGVICLPCFDKMANARLTTWMYALKELHFIGGKETCVSFPAFICQFWDEEEDDE